MAVAGSQADGVLGLEAGADDYIGKTIVGNGYTETLGDPSAVGGFAGATVPRPLTSEHEPARFSHKQSELMQATSCQSAINPVRSRESVRGASSVSAVRPASRSRLRDTAPALRPDAAVRKRSLPAGRRSGRGPSVRRRAIGPHRASAFVESSSHAPAIAFHAMRWRASNCSSSSIPTARCVLPTPRRGAALVENEQRGGPSSAVVGAQIVAGG